MKRFVLIVISVLACTFAAAQDEIVLEPVTFKGPVFTVDVRRLASCCQDESPSMRASGRIITRSDTATRWIDRIYNMPQFYKRFYDNYGLKVNEVLNGIQNWLSDPGMAQYGIDDYGYPEYHVELNTWEISRIFKYPKDITDKNVINQYAINAVQDSIDAFYNSLDTFVPYLFLSMSYDFPQAFWIGNNYNWSYSYSAAISYWNGQGTVKLYFTGYYILKDSETDIRVSSFRTSNAIRSGVKEFHQCVDSILAGLPEGSHYYQALYLNDWLTKHNCYSNSKSNWNDIVWSPMSALRGTIGIDGPVCEGYARAFKVLSDAAGIPVMLASGKAREHSEDSFEGHMWNEVRMDDGKWYAVDVTWNDPVSKYKFDALSGLESHDWFMIGRNSIVNGMLFSETHYNTKLNNNENWDCSLETLIADNAYRTSDEVQAPKADANGRFTVHSITGVAIGSYPSFEDACRKLLPGLYIINNRKIHIR